MTANAQTLENKGFFRLSLLYRNGTPTQQTCYQTERSKRCAGVLGHSDVSTTMNVYAHATREAKRESAKLLDKVVGMN